MQIFIVLALLALGGGGYYYYETEYKPAQEAKKMEEEKQNMDHAHGDNDEHILSVDGTVLGSIAFLDSAAELTINGETHLLNQVQMASGIRYESEDGTMVYQEHQGDITVQTGAETYENVVAAEADAGLEVHGEAMMQNAEDAAQEVQEGAMNAMESATDAAVEAGAAMEAEVDAMVSGDASAETDVSAETNATAQ